MQEDPLPDGVGERDMHAAMFLLEKSLVDVLSELRGRVRRIQ
jgi:hypothetical protein